MIESDYDTQVDSVPEGFFIVGKAGVNCEACGVSAKR